MRLRKSWVSFVTSYETVNIFNFKFILSYIILSSVMRWDDESDRAARGNKKCQI